MFCIEFDALQSYKISKLNIENARLITITFSFILPVEKWQSALVYTENADEHYLSQLTAEVVQITEPKGEQCVARLFFSTSLEK